MRFNFNVFLFSDFTDQLHLLADAFNKYEVRYTMCTTHDELHASSSLKSLFKSHPFVSSDRSSYSDVVQLSIHPLFQIFTQSIDEIDVTSVALR